MDPNKKAVQFLNWFQLLYAQRHKTSYRWPKTPCGIHCVPVYHFVHWSFNTVHVNYVAIFYDNKLLEMPHHIISFSFTIQENGFISSFCVNSIKLSKQLDNFVCGSIFKTKEEKNKLSVAWAKMMHIPSKATLIWYEITAQQQSSLELKYDYGIHKKVVKPPHQNRSILLAMARLYKIYLQEYGRLTIIIITA